MACKIISNSSKQPPRRGAVLLLTIVCVAVALAIMAALVQVALLRYATQQNHQRRAQATCLVESGLDRAVARLAADPAYKGETWTIAAAEFNPAADDDIPSALVRIEIKTVANNPHNREIHITADYADDLKSRARRSKQTAVTLIPSKIEEPATEKPDAINSQNEKPKQQTPP